MYCTLKYTHNFLNLCKAHFRILVAIIAKFAMQWPLLSTDKVNVTIVFFTKQKRYKYIRCLNISH